MEVLEIAEAIARIERAGRGDHTGTRRNRLAADCLILPQARLRLADIQEIAFGPHPIPWRGALEQRVGEVRGSFKPDRAGVGQRTIAADRRARICPQAGGGEAYTAERQVARQPRVWVLGRISDPQVRVRPIDRGHIGGVEEGEIAPGLYVLRDGGGVKRPIRVGTRIKVARGRVPHCHDKYVCVRGSVCPGAVTGELVQHREEGVDVDVVLGGSIGQPVISAVDTEGIPAKADRGIRVVDDPVAERRGAVFVALLASSGEELRERDASPGHVAHGAASEAELRRDVHRPIGMDEVVGLRGAIIEHVGSDIVGLPQSPVIVGRVVRLSIQQTIAEHPSPHAIVTGATRQKREDRERVIIRKRRAEEPVLVGVALDQTRRRALVVGIHHRLKKPVAALDRVQQRC